MSYPSTHNPHLWTTAKDLPAEIREAVIWRLGHWGQLDDADWQRLHELCGAGKQSVQEIFEAERLRWAVIHLLNAVPGITVKAAFQAVALVACKSPSRVKQVFYRQIRKSQSSYEVEAS